MCAVETSKILGRVDTLETRLAVTAQEVIESQRLRYKIFFEEMSAIADEKTLEQKLDQDIFDKYCDHLLVFDRSKKQQTTNPIIGSYRLLSQQKAVNCDGFYSAKLFEIDSLLARHPDKNFLEFGRSCVLPDYRNKRTIELLWQGSWAYVLDNKIDVMFGCASFEGTDPDKISEGLSFLYHNSRADGDWKTGARGDDVVDMNRLDADRLDQRAALRQLPPLIKGYLRLGAMIGEKAVIDYQFGTIDVLIILPVSALNPRYIKYYGPNAERHRADT